MGFLSSLRKSDLRGFSRLARTFAVDLTDVVEHMHATLGAPLGMAHNSVRGRTGGITGVVYGTIRGMTHGLGLGMETALALSERDPGNHDPSTPEREALIAVLNGVWGDHLAEDNNPLAIPMTLRHRGTPLVLEKSSLDQVLPHANGRILLLAHGLCMNDLKWLRLGHDHGAELAGDLDYTPLYLHYNSGLHVSTNGRALAALLNRLVEAWPHPIEELVIVAHSMGGLVTRSACHYGAQENAPWLAHLRKVVCLGTPHHGSPVEKGGNWLDAGMGSLPLTAPFQRLGQRRSAGITDLRYGSIVDEDWHGADRFEPLPDSRLPVPLTEGVTWYAMAATTATPKGSLKASLLGDGLVSVESALGRHKDPARMLHFAPERQWVGYEMNHTDLLWKPAAYSQLVRWVGE